MSKEPQRTCPSCGNEFSGAMEFCPVCLLRKGLADGVESGESSAFEEAAKPTPEQATQRFEHYELVRGGDDKPVELGRGAMGVTYKAFDVDLHCPVTLKHIAEPCLFWTALSRSKIRLVHKKDGYGSLPFRRCCASLLPSIRGFV